MFRDSIRLLSLRYVHLSEPHSDIAPVHHRRHVLLPGPLVHPCRQPRASLVLAFEGVPVVGTRLGELFRGFLDSDECDACGEGQGGEGEAGVL